MAESRPLTSLQVGSEIVVGGDRLLRVDRELADRFQSGDCLKVVEATGQVLLIPKAQRALASAAVDRAATAFSQMGSVSDQQISGFFDRFAARLADDSVWSEIARINAQDVESARQRGRSVTRLVATDKLRQGMIDGLRGWIGADSKRGKVIERVSHDGWVAELVGAELGVVGFVFEGRPNVVADATGVLRGGNTVVFRIGRDALETAKSILALATGPALEASGLPQGAVSLVESPEHAAGWALFSDRRLSLAVARGSGPAVATLGSLAESAGIAVSLHGTGGAWIIATEHAEGQAFESAVRDSLDRKVCNTLNTCCITLGAAKRLVPAFLRGLEAAAKKRGHAFKLHVVTEDTEHVPSSLFEAEVSIGRADGSRQERQAVSIAEQELGREWEWEDSPEVTLKIASDLEHAISLFNRYSPNFVASLMSQKEVEHAAFYQKINAPFVGDGFTRWVDGQFALNRPELGLSNWQHGRLFGRGGILSGDSVFTIRTRVKTGERA